MFVGHSMTGRGARPAIGTPQLVPVDDRVLAYYDHGHGSPVVLLASLARPVSDFNELVSALVLAGHRTLAIESRGIGGSSGGGLFASATLHDLADDVLPVLAASGLAPDTRVDVIGHAFGNRVARTFAADHPERVRSLILLAAGGRAPVDPRARRAILASVASFLPWRMREPELRFAFFARDSEIPPHWRGGWSLWGSIGQAAAVEMGLSREFWGGGSAPMLVVQAEQDAVAPPADAGLPLREEFPNRVTLVELRGAGHAMLPERPDPIRDAVLSFLRAQRIPG